MLTHLSIQNFTLVEQLDLEFAGGMTVITGETGAGKSILLEALGHTLGDRADATRVRTGAKKADITATFDLADLPGARQWLTEQELQQDAEPAECLLRRTVSAEGRSKAYINARPVTLAQLRELGEQLMDIHSQHEHQSLLVKDNHRRLLDEYAGHTDLAERVRAAYRQWRQRADHLADLRENASELNARYQLASYQVEELDKLALQDGEIDELEQEQRLLASAEHILHSSQQLVQLCSDDEQGLNTRLHQAVSLLRQLDNKPEALTEAEQLLDNAQIQVEEAQRNVEHYADTFEMDPARLAQVEERLSAIYDIARKHRIQPVELPELHERLAQELAELDGGDERLEQLETEVQALEDDYRNLAGKLSKQRRKAAKSLCERVGKHLRELAMEHAVLSVDFAERSDRPTAHGLEDVELLISTNPGQPARALARVASGGELSRVSLAIQVVAAENSHIPSLVFDEVDVGIGGATADTVGRLLRQLAARGQILCVTHLAQVASKGHQHLRVVKTSRKDSADTSLVHLEAEDKIEELARMLGGASVTAESRAHAEQMLTDAG